MKKKTYAPEEAKEFQLTEIAKLDERAAPLEGAIEAPEVTVFVDNSAEYQFYKRVENVLRIDGEYRTSIVVDPLNGRIPLRDDALENTFRGEWRQAGFKNLDGPEMAGPGPRCLLDFGPVPPAGPIVPISANFQFVQNENYVVLYIEAGAELRIPWLYTLIMYTRNHRLLYFVHLNFSKLESALPLFQKTRFFIALPSLILKFIRSRGQEK